MTIHRFRKMFKSLPYVTRHTLSSYKHVWIHYYKHAPEFWNADTISRGVACYFVSTSVEKAAKLLAVLWVLNVNDVDTTLCWLQVCIHESVLHQQPS